MASWDELVGQGAEPQRSWDQLVSAEPRSLFKEVPLQAYAGATIELPKMAGQALQWATPEDSALHAIGKELADWAEQRAAANPDLEPQLEGRSWIGKGLTIAGRMIPPSVVAMVPAAAAAPLGAVAAGAGAAAASFGMFGASQAQETYDNVLKAGGTPEQARTAGWINFAIEGAGETLGTIAGYKLLGIGAKALEKAGMSPVQAAIRGATETAVVKPFLKQLPKTVAVEAGTEFGQNWGEAVVEQAYGVEGKQPFEEGVQGALGALGMTALLAPFGLAGFSARAKSNAKVAEALQNPDTPESIRMGAAKLLYDEISGVDQEAGQAWSQNASIAIATKAPILLDESFAQRSVREDAEAVGNVTQAPDENAAIAAAMKATEPEPVHISDVTESLLDRGIISDEMAGAVARAERLTAEQAARDQAFERHDAEVAAAKARAEMANARFAARETAGAEQARAEEIGKLAREDVESRASELANRLIAFRAKGLSTPTALAYEAGLVRAIERLGFEAPTREEIQNENARVTQPSGTTSRTGTPGAAGVAGEAGATGAGGTPGAAGTGGAPRLAGHAAQGLDLGGNAPAVGGIHAITEQGATTLDVLQPPGNGEALGGRNAQYQEPAGVQAQAQAPQRTDLRRYAVGQPQEPQPAATAAAQAAPQVHINGQLPAEMSVSQLQHAAKSAPYFDQKDAAKAELKRRDRKGETVMGRAVDQLTDAELKVVERKGKSNTLKDAAKAEIARRTAADQDLADRLRAPGVPEELQAFAGEAGWAERGGHFIRVQHSEVSGDETISRTKWVPKAEWWPGRPVKEGEEFYREAVRKAVAGEQLSRKQKDVVRFLVGMAEDRRTGFEALPETTPQHAVQAEVVQAEQGPAADNWSTLTQEQKDAELDALFGQNSRPVQAPAPGANARPADVAAALGPRGAGEAGQAGQAAEVTPERPALALAGQTESQARAEDLARQRAEEGRRRREAAPPPSEFALAGSNRAADQAIARGQNELFRPQNPEQRPAPPVAESQAPATSEPGEAAVARGREGGAPESVATSANPLTQAADALIQAAEAMKAAVVPKAEPTAPKAETRIADVGENLWANRRNFTRGAINWDNVKDLNDALKVKEVVKAKVWPKPDYEELVAQGMEPFIARMLKQVYDGLAAAPVDRTDAGLQRYMEVVGRVREAVFDWAKDNNANREFLNSIAARAQRQLGAMRGQATSLTSMLEPANFRDVILDRVWPVGEGVRRFRTGTESLDDIRAIGAGRALRGLQFTMDDAIAAMKDIENGWPAPQEAWQRQGYQVLERDKALTVRKQEQPGGEAPIWVIEINGRYSNYSREEVTAETIFPTTAKWIVVNKRRNIVGWNETEEGAKQVARDLTKREAKGGDIRGMNVSEAERTGPERRQPGENVTAERMMEEFGFRGVNFGREGWINQAERQAYLNHAYDALLDLAEILNVSPKALSMNGMLGIAFGAQGRGGQNAAHFVPGHNEINLTKTKGAGTLAHEWGHALDHYFATQAYQAKRKAPFLSEYPTQGGEIRPEIAAAMKSVVEAMNRRPLTPEEYTTQQSMARAGALKSLEGWLRPFRNMLAGKEAALAEFEQLAERMRRGDLGEGYVQSGNKQFRPVIAQIRNLVKDATGHLAGLQETEALAAWAGALKFSLERKEADAEHVPQTTSTTYNRESAKADKEKGGKRYWATEYEKFARAFETYVADQLTERAQQNTFLSDAAIRAETKNREGTGFAMPYPRGEDRNAINGAIGKLVAEIKTRETDKGVAMFQRGSAGGMSSERLRSAVAPILQRWANAPEVVVVESMQDKAVPEAVQREDARQRSQGAFGEPEGFWYGGKVYLVASALPDQAAALRTLFHESHYGLRGTFGDSLNRVLDIVASGQRERVQAKAKEYGLDYGNVEQRRQAAEEVLAEIAATRPESGLVKRAIAAIRQFLRDIGFDVELSDNDIIEQFIIPARGFVERSNVRYAQQPQASFARGKKSSAAVDALNAKLREQEGIKRAFTVADFNDGGLSDAYKAAFGVEVVYVSPIDPQAEQFLGMHYKGRIYVQPESGKHGFMHLAGHELLHQIRSDAPHIYDWFAEQARAFGVPGATKSYGRRLEMAGATRFDAEEEMLADFTGDALADPAFLKQLAQVNGSKFTQLLEAALAWLRSVAAKLTGSGFGSSAHFTNVDELRKYLAGVLDAYRVSGDADAIDDLSFARSRREGNDVVIALTRAEREFFGRVFASEADRTKLLSEVPSARFDTENLAVAESDLGALSDYADRSVTAARGEGYRVPPSFEKATFPPRPDIRFSRTPSIAGTATVGETVFRSKQFAGFLSGLTAKSPASLGVFNGINTQYHKAEMLARKGIPQFKAVFDRLNTYLGDISQIAVRAEQQAPAIFRELTGIGPKSLKTYFKGAASEKDIKAIGPWLFHGTLYGGASPTEGVVWTEDELRGQRASGSRVLPRIQPLSETQIPLYRQARAAINQSLEDNAKAIIYKHVAKFGIAFDRDMSLADVAETVREQLREMVDEVNLQIEAAQTHVDEVQATYDEAKAMVEADRSRASRVALDNAMIAQDRAEKALDGLHDQRDSLETLLGVAGNDEKPGIVNQIEKKAADLIVHGYTPLMRFGNRTVTAKDEEGKVMFFGTYDGTPLVPGSANQEMHRTADAIRVEHPDWTVTTGIKAEKAWRMYEGLSFEALENFLDFLDPETKAELQRDTVIQEYLSNAVNNRSVLKRLIHRSGTPGFSTDVPRMLASFITSNARNASGLYNIGEAKRLVNEIPKEHGDVQDEATDLVEYVTKPGEEAAKLRSFLFFHFLGGSIAAAAVNLTQTPLMTVPYLSQHAKASDVVSSILSAAKRAVQEPATLQGPVGDALQKAEAEGVTAPQQIYHLTATAANNPFTANRKFRAFMTAWGGMFGAAEVFNRRVAFIAAYDIANKNGIHGGAAYQFAVKAVTETQGIYSKVNRPNLGRGSIGATVMTFKQFNIMYLELLRRLPPQQQLIMLGILLLVSGVEGLPFSEDISDLVDTLGQWLGFSTNTGKWTGKVVKETFGKEYVRPVLKGLGGMLPIDLHSRLGMQNLIPATAFLKQSEIDKTRDVAEAVGPLGGILQSLSQSLQLLARGKWDNAAVNVAPKAARDAYNGMHMAITGESQDTRGRLAMRDVTLTEGFGKLVGFNPQRAAAESEAKREIMLDRNLRTVRMDDIASDWAEGIVKRDQEMVADASRRFREWNKDNPELRIDGSSMVRAVRERVKALRMTSEQRFLKSTPKPLRREAREALAQ